MIRELLFRDLGGTYLTEPRTVIEAAFDEPRYLERVPGLRAVVTDDSARRHHRYLAVVALASWGHDPVYPVVEGIAEAGRRSPWFNTLVAEDRDGTFPELAGAVAEGRRFTSSAARLAAVNALIGLGDEVFFGWPLRYAADEPGTADALAAVLDRGLDRTDEPDFDRNAQLAALCSVLAAHAPERAVEPARRLLRRDSRQLVRLYLNPVVPFRA
ncbi:hypothetical protein ACFFSW_08195 [Saccharothrix longispora]|uniref:HEAT repeat domain-containing protein n=1 Tax=Saccharothrix longispora TaxID=33920 RepID=A0ABU1Q6V6_9PSEU|nr:hypothetical protein [Saccharothrix longispora]MDR6598621.1 hypothetical protein [Saccharothrix longispora]